MVRGKGAALVALALAGAAYFFKNKRQVKQSIEDISQRAQRGTPQQGQQAQRGERSADWSQGNIA